MVFCDKDYLYSTQFRLISMAQPITEFYYPTTQKSYYSTAGRDSRRAGDPEGSRNYTRGGLFYPPHGPARVFYVIFKFSVPEPTHPFRVLTIPAGNHQFLRKEKTLFATFREPDQG